jgi:ATP-dependent protease Clp ATPase subunit
MFGRKKKEQTFNSQEFVNAWFAAQKKYDEECMLSEKVDEHKQQLQAEDNARRLGQTYQTNAKFFVDSYTPMKIEAELGEYVLGQSDLIRDVADFLYYHAMRQVIPELPVRPMMIAGPSGSGKTEVWRVAQKLYKNYFKIKIVDGSKLTNDGWSGSYKLVDVFDADMLHHGGILIVDEFDKLAKPQHSSTGDNVSAEMQFEFLKILEGEGEIARDKKNKFTADTKKMGFVFVGAFADLMEDLKKKKADNKIGFGKQNSAAEIKINEITDDDYIQYGVITEIVGRVSTKTVTNELTDDDYIAIIRNPHSRVSIMKKSLLSAGVDVPKITDEEIKELIKTTKTNKTGVRWVSSQIETKMLEGLRKNGIGKPKKEEVKVHLGDLVNMIKQAQQEQDDPER